MYMYRLKKIYNIKEVNFFIVIKHIIVLLVFFAAEFDLSDITNVKCKIVTLHNEDRICSDDLACKYIQR